MTHQKPSHAGVSFQGAGVLVEVLAKEIGI
jgi:hypothetical protein